MRSAAGMRLGVAEGDGRVVAEAGVITTVGSTQSIGCTTAFPVVWSYEMTRTPVLLAHSVTAALPAPPSEIA